MPVTGKNGVFCGVISFASLREALPDRDLWRWVLASDIMERAPETIGSEATALEAMTVMGDTNQDALVVMNRMEPEKVVGIHFMNPVPMIKGVEVIRGKQTSDDVLEASKEYVRSLDKEPCEAEDISGFIVSRLVDALMNEAIRCVMDGHKPEEIDKAMRLCCNYPIGPLELCDLAGADIVLHGTETMHADFGDAQKVGPDGS